MLRGEEVLTPRRASHARLAMWKLWFKSQDEWIRRGMPPLVPEPRPIWMDSPDDSEVEEEWSDED